ncbi:MAG: hypothetical protein R6V58_13595, partial [Planctomycetota bacterium]
MTTRPGRRRRQMTGAATGAILLATLVLACTGTAAGGDTPPSRGRGPAAKQAWWQPYSPPCTEREDVFEFTRKPSVQVVGKDQYEIT